MALKQNELPTLHVLWHYNNIKNINAFTADVENAIHELNRKNWEIIFAGDFNINLLNMVVRQTLSDFFNPCYQIAFP